MQKGVWVWARACGGGGERASRALFSLFDFFSDFSRLRFFSAPLLSARSAAMPGLSASLSSLSSLSLSVEDGISATGAFSSTTSPRSFPAAQPPFNLPFPFQPPRSSH